VKRPATPAAPALTTERDSVLREVEQLLMLARSVSLGPGFDDIIRMAVERATDRLVAATRRRTARLAALSAIQQTVTAGFDLPAIMTGVYDHLRDILDAPSFLVVSYDARASQLRCAFAVVDGEVVDSDTVPPMALGSGPASQVIRTGRPRIVNDGTAETIMAVPPASSGDDHRPMRSVLFVPMRKGDEIVGVMQAQSHHPDAYGPEEVDVLSTIANQTAMALENARLYQEALRRSREVEALLAAAHEIGGEVEPERVLGRIVEAAAHLVDAQLATIGSFTGEGMQFEQVWQEGVWRRVDLFAPEDASLPRGISAAPVLDNAPRPGATGLLAAVLPPVDSRLAVPVLGRDQRVLGVIALFNKRNHAGFTPRDLEMTSAFATHAAMAMERATAYRAMAQSRNYLQTLMDRSYAAIFVLDPVSGAVRDVNTAGGQLLSRSRDEALSLGIFDLAPSSGREDWQALIDETPAKGESLERELQLVSRDGAVIPLEVTATRVELNDTPALVCLCLDRRPRMRQEEAERLRSLGEMASGVAHDFNNMLGVILGRTEVMIGRTTVGVHATAEDLNVIKQAALDGSETVKRLQAFSGIKRLPQNEVSDINQLLRDVVEFTRARWRDAAHQRGVTIDVVAEPGDVPPVKGGAAELREVLVNLIFNATDAMPEGGRITMRTFRRDDMVAVTVTDTGTGMPESVRSRVFEPFFTTKGTRGNGLGLSASYGIISRLGGTMVVDSAPDQGTTFTIELPVGEVQVATEETTSLSTGPLDLLIVDDEPQMLLTTSMMLEIEGHRVTSAASGRAALAALESGRFDAVLTDLGMPEINGLQLAGMIRERGFALPILLITGWGLELEVEKVRAAGVTDVLPKPFDGDKLRAALAAIPALGRVAALT
jgi:PAS domain S-box-containing protein